MNNVYRVVWNATHCVWQAVSEIASSGGKTKSVAVARSGGSARQAAQFVVAGLSMACALAYAQSVLPVISAEPNAVTGATIDASVANTLTIQQSASKAILNWESFSIGSGDTVTFVQPNSSAIALNRVVGDGNTIARSMIDGTINANGQVFLVNPEGITFGHGSQVNVGGIVASTRDISDANFLEPADGKYSFTVDLSDAAATSGATVINNGTITASQYVVLIGARVINKPDVPSPGQATPQDGRIEAPNILLAAGDDIMLQLDGVGAPAIEVTRSTANALIENGGMLVSDGGKIFLTAAAVDDLLTSAINNNGVIEARGISANPDGSITFQGAKTVTNTGEVSAGTGEGTVEIASVDDVSNAATGTVEAAEIDIAAKKITIAAETSNPVVPALQASGEINLTADGTATGEGLTVSGVIQGGSVKIDASAMTVTATTGQVEATAGAVEVVASGNAVINGVVKSTGTVSEAGEIAITAQSLSLGASSVIDASGSTAGAVTTDARTYTIATGAQVQTLKDANDLGTWTVKAGDTFVTTTGTSAVATALDNVVTASLLNADVTVDTATGYAAFQTQANAAAGGSSAQTSVAIAKGWNIFVADDLVKPEPTGRIITGTNPTPDPQDVTLTLKSGRDITIDAAITSTHNKGRLNLVLDAAKDVVVNGTINTGNGNFYVGRVSAAGVNSSSSWLVTQDTVVASGDNLTIATTGAVNVGSGHFVARVDNTITNDGSIQKTGSSGTSNTTKKAVYNNSWQYPSLTYGGVYTTSQNSLNLQAAAVVGAGTVAATNGIVNVTAPAIGVATSDDTHFKINANTLNVTNSGTGGTYISNPNSGFTNITLTTAGDTNGLQRILMSAGRKVEATANSANETLTIAEGGVNVDQVGSLTIQSPNLVLGQGAISSTTGTASVNASDPSLKDPSGTILALTARVGGTYGYILASAAADADAAAEINIPFGTVTLQAANIGTDGATPGTNFVNALEINTTALNVQSAGGATWIANSEYNRLNFSAIDAIISGVGGAGWHHILSRNGDFFNIETTSDAKLVVYSIDRNSPADGPEADKRMSGIYTRSDADAPRNVTLDTGGSASARDIIFMNDAVDIGAATMTLGAQGGKKIMGSSEKKVQDDTTHLSASLTTYVAGAATNAVPQLTLGNLNMNLMSAGSSIGAADFDIKVAKGGADNQVNAETNKLNIYSLYGGGDIALRELSAQHFKDITITDVNTVNANTTVKLELFDNGDVDEKVFYTDASGGTLSFNTGQADNVIALSGYDRNLTLDVRMKDVVVGGYGNDAKISAGNKIGSGSLSINANALTLGGDITTTYRTNANASFDTGNVSLRATSYSLSDDVAIKTNGDLANSERGTRTPGSVSVLRGGQGTTGASNLTGNGHSLAIDTASTETNVNGGNITAQFLAAGTSAANAVKNLSFTSSWASGNGGLVNLNGSAYNISGNFSATGRVTLVGSSSPNNTMVSDFSIRTNVGDPVESGSITFGGNSLTMNKGYGAATFDASATGTNTAGDITLWSSDMAGGSSLSAGNWLVDASAVDVTKAGEVTVDNLTTSGRATATSGSSYTAANLEIKAKAASLAGNLSTRSGGSTGSAANTGDVLVLADTVTIADNVKIQTYNGYTGNSSNADKTGLAGDVTLGNVGATLVGAGKTLEIDASAGRSFTGTNTSFTAQHGTIAINDTNASPNGTGTTFEKLTLIGLDVMGNGVRKYRTSGQMTLGFLGLSGVNLGSVEAGSLLLLGTGTTSYTTSGAKVGTLAAMGVDDLTLATHASWQTDLSIGTLSYSGTFASAANGIAAAGQVDVATGGSKIILEATKSVVGEKVQLTSSSTDAAQGGIELKSGSTVDGGADAVELVTQAGNITVAQGATLKSTLSADRALLLSAGTSSSQDGHVVLAGTGPVYNLTGNDAYGMIFTGSWSEAKANSETGYTSLGAGHYTYGATSLPQSFTPDANNSLDSASQKTYAFFRGDGPNVELTFSNKIYNGLGFELFSTTAGNAALNLGGDGLLFADKVKFDQATNSQKADVASYLLGLDASSVNITQDGGQALVPADVMDVGQYLVTVNSPSTPAAFGYDLQMPPTSSNNYAITPKQLTVSLVNVSKTYDGTTAATLVAGNYGFSGFVNQSEQSDFNARNVGIQTSTQAAFNSKDVLDANAVTIALTDADLSVPDAQTVQSPVFKASNYTIAGTASGTGAISAKALAVAFNSSGAYGKVYDGSSSATLDPTSALVLSGVITGDAITVNVNTGVYGYTDTNSNWVDSARVSEVNAVRTNVNYGDLVAGSGTNLTNYSLANATPQASTTLTPKALIASATARDKPFDGKTDAEAAVTFDRLGIVGSDEVNIQFVDAHFEDNKVGIDKTVTLFGVSLTGQDASNYAVSVDGVQPTDEVPATAAILPIDQPPIVVPQAPQVVVNMPAGNQGNTPLASVGGLGVVNLETTSATAEGDQNAALETLTVDETQVNKVFVLNGGINTRK